MQFKARSLNCGCKNRNLISNYHMLQRLILLFIFSACVTVALPQTGSLTEGDSLFARQKYTEAFEIYQDLFSEGQFSASMLLKMAFIKDGLGDYPEALYYLDLYYRRSADRSVVSKIQEISQEKNLVGFNYNDTHFFKALLAKYRAEIQAGLVVLSVLLMYYIYRKRRNQEKPVTATVFQLLIFAALVLVTNNLFETKQGIISNDNTLLRSGPSAGAEPVTMIERGHKVKVLDQTEVWTKISWEGQEVFVRNGKLKVI